MMPPDDLQQSIRSIRDQVTTHLAGRSGTWLASFAELVDIAEDRGVPIVGLQPVLTSLLDPDAHGEVLEDGQREALIDALVGRWAATQFPEHP